MTVNPDEGFTGLDRENNQRPDVNQEAKDGEDVSRGGDATKERMKELTDAAKDDDR